MKSYKLSVIIPFYNECKNLANLHREIIDELSHIGRLEIIYVDDGSADGSAQELTASFGKKDRQHATIKVVSLRRNLGQTAATMAGVDQSTGDLIAFLDADLQNDPRDIPKLLKKIDDGYEAVVGWRNNRKDSFFHSFSSKITNNIVRLILKVPLHDAGCSLKIIKREILQGTRLYGEYHRLIAILLYWRGVSLIEVPVNHRPRTYGSSKYNYLKIFKFIIDLITIKFFNSYGLQPSYFFSMAGLFCCFLSIFPIALTLYEKIVQGVFVHRNPLLLIAIFLFLLGVQFIFIGLLAELLVRIYFESLNKFTYDIKKVKVY